MHHLISATMRGEKILQLDTINRHRVVLAATDSRETNTISSASYCKFSRSGRFLIVFLYFHRPRVRAGRTRSI